jgi:hypothetical protein
MDESDFGSPHGVFALSDWISIKEVQFDVSGNDNVDSHHVYSTYEDGGGSNVGFAIESIDVQQTLGGHFPPDHEAPNSADVVTVIFIRGAGSAAGSETPTDQSP